MPNKLKFIRSTISCIVLIISFLSLYGQSRREVGNMILEDIPEIPEEVKNRVHQYLNTRSAFITDWLPDEQGILISTRFGNTDQLHIVEKPGGARNQITFFEEPVTDGLYCPSPDYNGFLFTKDFGGNEFSQIFWYDMEIRNYSMISDGESVNLGVLWSNKGDKFAFTSTRRNKRDFDIYVSSMSSPKEAELKVDKGSGYWIATDWSPEDDKLLLIQYLSANESNSFIFDLNNNSLTQINNPNSESFFLAMTWDKTGEKIYAITDEGKEFRTLVLYDTKEKQYEYITSDISWDVESIVMNNTKSQAAFTVNENGFLRLYILNTDTNTYRKVTNIPDGQIIPAKFSPTKPNLLALVIDNYSSPGDTYTLDLDNGLVERWTYSEVGGLNTSAFPKPELFHYETFDKINGEPGMIPAFIYKPDKPSNKPTPVLIRIHGGPEGQFNPYFDSGIAHRTNEMGIAVIAPNVRGSSGYGKEYLKLDNGYNRENSVKDIGKLLEWIESQPDLDQNRIAVIGGSYGGYMVLSSMFNYNDKIRCGIDIVGISNFVTFLENTEEYRRDLRRIEYGDERDPEMRKFLNSISPSNNAEKITKPLFVIQGANDPRVPASESEQMVRIIRENNGTVWYMLAKDEGHGFRKKANQDMMAEAIVLFLEKNLLSD